MESEENSKQTGKADVWLGRYGAIASILGLIVALWLNASWYVYLIIFAILCIVIYWSRREYIVRCLDKREFRSYWSKKAIYIPIDIQKEDPIENSNAERRKLKEFFIDRLFKRGECINSHYFLLGDSGSGKTAALVQLLIDYVKKYNFKPRPYEIRLYSMSIGDKKLWEKIDADIPKKDRGKYILLLDALDENNYLLKALANFEITLEKYLQDLAEKTEDFARVVVSCRQQFFMKKEDEPRHPWENYYISPFSDKQIDAYLTKKFGTPSPERRNEQARKIVHGNKDLFLRPLILANIDDILDYYGPDREELTTKEIYDAIVMSWVKREEPNDETKRNRLLNMSLELAKYMYKHNLNAVDDGQYKWFLVEHKLGDPKSKFRPRSLLNRGSSGYKFSHKTFYDYFLAYWFFLNPDDIGSAQGMMKTLQFYDEIREAKKSGNLTEVDKIFKTHEVSKYSIAAGMYNWANELSAINQHRNAEPRYNVALELFRELANEEPDKFMDDVADTLNNLANLHSDTHDYDSAAKEYQEALDIRRNLAEENPGAFLPDMAQTLNNLAALHCNTNDYDSAAKEYQEALDTYRKLAEENPDAFLPYVATTLNNLAILHKNTHYYDSAAKEYQEALAIRRNLAEENPDAFLPDVAQTLNNLGTLHSDTHDYDSAAKEYQEALDIRRKLAEENPDAFLPDVATTLNNLANLHGDTHDYDSAANEYQEALYIRRKLAEENPGAFLPDVANTLNNLANLHGDTHDYDSAAKEYQEALDIRRKLAEENPDAFLPDVAGTLNNLGTLHSDTHDYDSAAKEYQEALDIRRNLAEESPDAFLPDVAQTLNNLAALHFNTHDYDSAAKEYQEALDIRRKLAEDNPDAFLPYVATTLNNLAALHNNTNDYDSAAKECQEALDIRRKLAEENPDVFLPDVAQTLYNIASLNMEQGQLTQAEEAASESLEIYTLMAEKSPAAFSQDREDARQLLDDIHTQMAEENS